MRATIIITSLLIILLSVGFAGQVKADPWREHRHHGWYGHRPHLRVFIPPPPPVYVPAPRVYVDPPVYGYRRHRYYDPRHYEHRYRHDHRHYYR